MSNLIRYLCLCLVFCFSVYAETNPIIEGSSRLDISKFKSADLRNEGINQALANAIETYIASYHKEYLPFFTKNVKRDVLVKRAQELIPHYDLIQEQKTQKGIFYTDVRAEFQFSEFKQRLRKFALVNRVESGGQSQFAVFIFAREKTSAAKFTALNISDTELEQAIKQGVQQEGFFVMDSQQFETMSGGNFRHKDLREEFVKTGLVDWRQARLAAQMAALKQTDVYLLIGNFETEYLGPEKYLPKLLRYNVRGTVEIINTVTDQSEGVLTAQGEFADESNDRARQQGIQEIGRHLAEKITAQLYSNEKY